MDTFTRRIGSWTYGLLKKRGAELCLGLMILALLVLHGTETPTRKPPEIESWEDLEPLDERFDLYRRAPESPSGPPDRERVPRGLLVPPNPLEPTPPPTRKRGRPE